MRRRWSRVFCYRENVSRILTAILYLCANMINYIIYCFIASGDYWFFSEILSIFLYMYMKYLMIESIVWDALICFFRYLILLNKWLTIREKLKAWRIFVIICIFYHVSIFKSRWFSCKIEERIKRENSEGYSTTCQRVAVYCCGEVTSKIYC